MIDRYLRSRYSRQIMFPAIGEEGQVKLGKGNVVIIGCGALGTNIATLLVRAGVGKVRIVDRDFIEYHNLQRQVLFDEEDIRNNLPKAIAAERHLRKVNSSVEIEGIVADANYTNIEGFCSGANVILDGLDNFETRLLINDVALKHRIPWVYGGAIASSGMTMTIIPGESPCFRCIHPFLPDSDTAPTCETAGIVGTVPAIIGSLEATEAMKILVGSEEVNRGLIMIDVWRGSFDNTKLGRREDCPACHGKYDFLDERFIIKTTSFCGQSRAVQVVNTKVTEIDLDELAERLASLGGVSHNEFMLRFNVHNKEIIVFPDGRAIVRNTIDESLAKELYVRYVTDLK
jgi:molybdopterin/thiamine biosynthesis adenylyltransferase